MDAVTKEYYQRLEMSHAEQVERFGWCMCDDNECIECSKNLTADDHGSDTCQFCQGNLRRR